MAMKKILSNVLSDVNVKWHKITEETISDIPDRTPLTIRIFNPKIVTNEDDDQIIFAEERRIGIYDKSDSTWKIFEPFPKYNFSLLVDDHGYLTEDTLVSHWDIATEKDLDDYAKRLDNLITWKHLNFECDHSQEESVYKALMFMQDVIRQYYALSTSFGEPDPNVKTMSELSIGLLHDLISIIDMGHPIHNENVDEKLSTETENTSEE